ncbi:MAG: cytochrome c biogenesis protein CcdA [Oscillospiraceae bacterium]|nr:cytochrome c biogenesis protein CcdA [Oscillospiraceae bacterium]
MTGLITFLEGLFSFLSPCMLPMLPVYLSYFAGDAGHEGKKLGRILAFILGFTLCFVVLGLGFGLVGQLLTAHKQWVNLVCGAVMIIFGLSFMELIQLSFFKGMQSGGNVSGLLSAFIFGLVYAINLTPCIGAFLGSALMLAASSGGLWQGFWLLLLYSLGLGLPFLLSALLVSHLDMVFAGLKKHYVAFNRICGAFLILVGILTASGQMDRLIGKLL